MGEYADMAIEEALNGWEYMENHPDEFHWTELDGGYFRGLGRRGFISRRKIPTCKFCKETHLHWGQTDNGRWQLEDWDEEEEDFIPHVCKLKNRWKSNTNTATSLPPHLLVI